MVWLFAVCSLGFECERAKYITFSFFASYFSLQSRSQRYHLAGQHYARRGGTSKKERNSGLDLCYHFRPYFLDLSIPQIPRKFKEIHLTLHPLKSGRNVISFLPYFSACTVVMALLPVRLLFSSGRLVVYLSFTSSSLVYFSSFSPSNLLPLAQLFKARLK